MMRRWFWELEIEYDGRGRQRQTVTIRVPDVVFYVLASAVLLALVRYGGQFR